MLKAHYEDKYEFEHMDHDHVHGCEEELNLTDKKNVEELDDICDDFYALEKYMSDLQTLAKIEMRMAADSKGPELPSDISAALENGDLRNLLGETSNMNATMSANQYKMQKKEMSQRMNSLAFKMEKVYNLDKRKTTAGVVKHFKKTFEDCLDN